MKQFFKMFFASLLAMIVAGVIVFGLVIGMIVSAVSKSMTAEKKTKVVASSVLVLEMDKSVHEVGENNSFDFFNDENSYKTGLYDLTKAINNAKTDNNIKGILIDIDASPMGWATMEQLRMALNDFKQSGKFIYAYGENIPQKAYYLASAADYVYLNPLGHIELKGFSTELAFFKGTFDKLGIVPEIYYAGKYKSATEPFRAEKISDANREQIMALQMDFWKRYVHAVSKHSGKDTTVVEEMVQKGRIEFPADALKYQIVDGLKYKDELEQQLREKTGTAADKDIQYVTLDEYAGNMKGTHKIEDAKIAIINAEGSIVDGTPSEHEIGSEDMAELISKVRKNDKIKAVVLRVNSPGGSALASEVILRELKLLKAKKPLVVAMGDVAASGGYYISTCADSIFAMPYTITGSIGVFSMLFSLESMMKNKLGVTFDVVKNAPYADVPTATRTMTADENKRMQNSVDTIYEVFKNRVSTGRKLTMAEVDSIAQGRVWTGVMAEKLHLVDAMGNINRALKSAATLAKVSDYQVVSYPQSVDKFEKLIKKFKGNKAAAAAVAGAMEKELGVDYQYYKQVQQLRNMNGKMMMTLPFNIDMH
jgi:protease-4